MASINISACNLFQPKALGIKTALRSLSLAPMAIKASITHVIFDMDGLLLDTEKFYTEVQEIFLARYNKTFDWSLKPKMMGKKAIEAAQVFVEETGISDLLSAEDFLVEREEMLQRMFPTCELMPGAGGLIQHFHATGVPIAVATGSHRRHFELKTRRHGGPIDPRKILVFEDAPNGVLSAKSAGMSVVMIPDPRLDSSFHETADQVLSSLLDFNPSEWGLPPFEKAD